MNKKIISMMIVGLIILCGFVFAFYHWGIGAVSSQSEEVIVEIPSGSNASSILKQLDEAGLVNNKLCGQVFLKLNTYDHLQANTYILNTNMSLSRIYDIMEDPQSENIVQSKLTIKEGQTIPEVASSFAEILGVSQEEVIQQWADKEYLQSLIDSYWFIDESILNDDLMYPLEGYLYPETYFITGENPQLNDMTKKALDMMDQQLSQYKDDIDNMGWSVHEFLSFASVVERESLFDKDRPQIAGVFMNRLNHDMLLQSDITVNYALQRTGVDVSVSQTQVDSPYNTYKYKGLPVGPISTISQKTMEACIHYTKSDYYYFFAKEDGTVIYSRTYEEHMQAVKENKWY